MISKSRKFKITYNNLKLKTAIKRWKIMSTWFAKMFTWLRFKFKAKSWWIMKKQSKKSKRMKWKRKKKILLLTLKYILLLLSKAIYNIKDNINCKISIKYYIEWKEEGAVKFWLKGHFKNTLKGDYA